MKETLIEIYRSTGKFTAQEYSLSESESQDWVEFQTNPQRFLPRIFDGNWARPERHPQAGTLKLLRVVEGNDGVLRIIGRQGNAIYASPWIG